MPKFEVKREIHEGEMRYNFLSGKSFVVEVYGF